MRALLIVSYTLTIILAVVSMHFLPEQVATHFGAGGHADGWGARESNAMMFAGIQTSLFLLFAFLPCAIRHIPGQWINIPNREYWLAAERREITQRMIAGLLDVYGTGFFVFMTGFFILVIRANLSTPVHLHEPTLFILLGIFLVFTAGWVVAFYRKFRSPSPDVRTWGDTGTGYGDDGFYR
ncbi:DUF1648 domain-containing protein [bacterium]|nr:DUF1648 domain-containing protein [candidate division CSSED10-310 bacterium]